MAVSQEWPLRFGSYNRLMGINRACVDSGNDDTLFLLGLVRTQFFSSLNTVIYLMPVFDGRRSFMNWVREWRGSNTCSK
jgi:hypothetical protein